MLPFAREEAGDEFVADGQVLVFVFNMFVTFFMVEKERERGRDKKGRNEMTYSECSMHQAATKPAIAPLAPRDVIVSRCRRTCDARETNDPTTPEARYRDKKLPRPISSCTATLSQLIRIKEEVEEGGGWREGGRGYVLAR